MTDDQSQLGFEIEFDDQTQSWLEWSDPDHMESAIRTLLRETVPGIADYSDLWWQPPLSTRIIEAARVRFESWDGFLAPENHSNADQFIRFVGECIRRQHPGMVWTTSKLTYNPLYAGYGFRPAVHFPDGHREEPVSMVETLFRIESAEHLDYAIREAGTSA
ncbi:MULTISPECIES: hypothetical protein [Nocardia]|uniref:Uncharacterized protein n=1 Tax=Nocardia africana TaxID=134964 RepID=A0A378X789_9NOCA|nr:hypothetical protein [Nocardia africana]MCC3317872.1 hypothetical protein [Nocardia africana]SUA48645.1 Uncharacterised protein [Nocardia africana]